LLIADNFGKAIIKADKMSDKDGPDSTGGPQNVADVAEGDAAEGSVRFYKCSISISDLFSVLF
jgi:hypothetical protein